ncbi:HEAT repeat domain-containing protein [Kitasatospora sp. NPDC085464]|uniref:HEAT repeat domain-containing protein n=1 Tax=Kitasatospora sp. NPDC085464 TaxID=3364063 RepID=UPI0037C92DDA
MGGDPVIEAVRRGDDDAVRVLLAGGADPEAVDGRGVSALCLAVAAFDSSAAGHLVEAGADALRRLPDWSTPLLRAVDSGSVALVIEVLGGAPLDGAAGAELLARARLWHERGPVAVLRERTGASGPVEYGRVRDRDGVSWCHEVRLGGSAVHDGHAGVLTLLEEHLGLRPGVGELAGRACALEHPDGEHASWLQIVGTLAGRQDDATWLAAAALRAHPDPLRRRFGAQVLASLHLGGYRHGTRSPFLERARELFLDWGAAEEHPDVLAEVLGGLAPFRDPRIQPLGLARLGHPAPQVRARVAALLESTPSRGLERWTYTPEGLDAMLRLARDPDAGVREDAVYQLADRKDPSPAVGDALAAALDDEEQDIRIWAVFGLAERDDPRCVEGAGRVGAVADRAARAWILDAPARFERRRREREAAAASE